MAHNLTVSIPELLIILGTVIAFATSIFGVWGNLRLKIQRIELDNKRGLENLRLEMEVKIKAIDSKAAGAAQFLGQRLKEFVDDNKSDHDEIKKDVKEINKQIGEVNINVARIGNNRH